MSLLVPDYMKYSYREVTPEFLAAIGVKSLLVDIDNTLAPYEQPEPDDGNRKWIADLTAAGIQLAVISNNHLPRVKRFCDPMGIPYYTESGKPKTKNLICAMRDLGVTRTETAVLGDQLFTDALAGKRLGLPTIIVPPIKDRTSAFFRFKRFFERPFIRRYMKKHPEFVYPDIYKRNWQETVPGKDPT